MIRFYAKNILKMYYSSTMFKSMISFFSHVKKQGMYDHYNKILFLFSYLSFIMKDGSFIYLSIKTNVTEWNRVKAISRPLVCCPNSVINSKIHSETHKLHNITKLIKKNACCFKKRRLYLQSQSVRYLNRYMICIRARLPDV